MSLFIFTACSKQVVKETDSVSLNEKQVSIKVPEKYKSFQNSIETFFEPLKKSESGEWLDSHKEEGQTFEEYINSDSILPDEKRRIIYIQPLGTFNKKQLKIINLVSEFIGKFYNLETKILKNKEFEKPMSLANHRIHPQFKIKQIRTGYILNDLLLPNLPEDAAAQISFTYILTRIITLFLVRLV